MYGRQFILLGYQSAGSKHLWSGRCLHADEFDLNATNTGDKGAGISVDGFWTAQPTQSATTAGNIPAIIITKPNGGAYYWTSGLTCAQAATNNGAEGDCIDIQPTSSANSAVSQSIVFHALNSSGTSVPATILEGVDSNGNAYLSTAVATYLYFSAVRYADFTVGTLPSASTVPVGYAVSVHDATTFAVGTCTGGGSDTMIAVSNGTTWSCH